jgi:hemoglobin
MRTDRALPLLARALIVALTLVASTLVADRVQADDSLYRAFGERSGLAAIVDDAAVRWLADDRIKDEFDNLNIPRFKERLTDFLCELTGGPCHYKGRNMYLTHKGLHLREAQFDAQVEGLQAAMEKHEVPFRTQNKLLALLAPMERDIVTK